MPRPALTTTYHRWGCWVDGYTASPQQGKKTDWVWGTSGNADDSTAYMLAHDNWAGSEPSGDYNGSLENCMLVWADYDLLNEYCQSQRAAVCMMAGTLIEGTTSSTSSSNPTPFGAPRRLGGAEERTLLTTPWPSIATQSNQKEQKERKKG